VCVRERERERERKRERERRERIPYYVQEHRWNCVIPLLIGFIFLLK
jgi:hypothetical protein